jgi:hypothetical protein
MEVNGHLNTLARLGALNGVGREKLLPRPGIEFGFLVAQSLYRSNMLTKSIKIQHRTLRLHTMQPVLTSQHCQRWIRGSISDEGRHGGVTRK